MATDAPAAPITTERHWGLKHRTHITVDGGLGFVLVAAHEVANLPSVRRKGKSAEI